MSARPSRLLLLLENTDLAGILKLALRDYELDWHASPAPATDAMRRRGFDLALVDLSFGGRPLGLEVIREWRRMHLDLPVIALSDIPQPSLAVASLDAGADDFLRKPFHYDELLARLRKLLHRGGRKAPIRRAGGIVLSRSEFGFGGAAVKPDLRIVFPNGAQERLRPKQHGILQVLADRAGELVLKEELIRAVWGSDANEAGHSVNEYLSVLRRLFVRHGVDFNGLVANEPKTGWRIHPDARGPVREVGA